MNCGFWGMNRRKVAPNRADLALLFRSGFPEGPRCTPGFAFKEPPRTKNDITQKNDQVQTQISAVDRPNLSKGQVQVFPGTALSLLNRPSATRGVPKWRLPVCTPSLFTTQR